MIDPQTLGRRIKYFRKRAGMSQMDLELEIGGSAGMISRIEKGKVNPSRKTVREIAAKLNLNPNELDYLVGVTAKPATEEEIQSVREKVQYYLDQSAVIAYVTDERWRFLDVSKGFQKLLGVKQEIVDGIYGKTIIEVLLDENLGVKEFFDPRAYDEMVKTQLAYCKKEIEFMQDDEHLLRGIELMKEYPKYYEYWQGLENDELGIFYNRDERVIPFKVGPITFRMMYARERLLDNPRFEIVEYIPVNKYIRTVQNLLKGEK
ncbi:helix-turn-helix domain-containing protein [Candidatus Dojkabacteria bacterium]|nr:helix-turn-helix domain-containing protein [Candidatus Dojkabacteria bacterium]